MFKKLFNTKEAHNLWKRVANVKKSPAARSIGALHKVAVTAGYLTSTVESSFLALANRLDTKITNA